MDGTSGVPRPERPAAPRTKDAPLRAALANRRGRALDEGIAAACYTHGVRLGLAGEPLPDWLPTAPRWAREALGTGHASGLAIHRREKRGDSAGGPMP